ncbi:MAG TPA: acetate uptake transporter [Candidatus Limnocylindria bacterium]|nr:acetate uptake transporter [Candidatus Limnocylindria bacterium]
MPADRDEARVTATTVAKADPAPLGLAAFALTTFVLSFANAGIIGGSSVSVVLALALAYGGLAQLLAGMWEFRNGNTFGATAFSSYGAFWLSYAAFVFWFAGGLKAADAPGAVGTYLLAWGIFTAYMWIATLKHAWPVMIVFLLLTVTFFLLAIGEYGGNDTIHKLGGYVGILTAIAAWYASASNIINEAFKRQVLPR